MRNKRTKRNFTMNTNRRTQPLTVRVNDADRYEGPAERTLFNVVDKYGEWPTVRKYLRRLP